MRCSLVRCHLARIMLVLCAGKDSHLGKSFLRFLEFRKSKTKLLERDVFMREGRDPALVDASYVHVNILSPLCSCDLPATLIVNSSESKKVFRVFPRPPVPTPSVIISA